MWTLNEEYETSAGRVAAGRAGHGPDLVLAHGWPWSSYAWHRVIPTLSTYFTLHWYDMPGFGRSDLVPRRAPSLDVQGEVFGEMLDHWGLTAPRVVAHDFGGAVTLRAHLLHGWDYNALVLMNVVAMRPWGSDFFDHVGRHIEAFTGLPPHIHEAVVSAYIDGALVRPLVEDDRARLIAPWLSDQGRNSFYAQFALADEAYTAEVEHQYATLRCPTTILWGENDPWIPLARGAALAQAIGTEIHTLPDVGHLPQLEDPQRVAQALLTHLGAV